MTLVLVQERSGLVPVRRYVGETSDPIHGAAPERSRGHEDGGHGEHREPNPQARWGRSKPGQSFAYGLHGCREHRCQPQYEWQRDVRGELADVPKWRQSTLEQVLDRDREQPTRGTGVTGRYHHDTESQRGDQEEPFRNATAQPAKSESRDDRRPEDHC